MSGWWWWWWISGAGKIMRRMDYMGSRERIRWGERITEEWRVWRMLRRDNEK